MNTGLGEVLAKLNAVGEDVAADKPLVDLKGVIPMSDHHQTAVFLRLPQEGVLTEGAGPSEAAKERVLKFLSSVNKPDTIKCDIYTVLGANCMAGYQPHIKHAEVGKAPLFDTDAVLKEVNKPYTLCITVDLCHPSLLQKVVDTNGLQ